MIDKNTIYSYFQTDDFPTEEQFRATWDSFWHKSESIPMSSITGLNQLFQQTATVAQLNGKANVDGSNINVSAYQEKLNITNLIATAKEEVKTELLNGAPEAFDTLKEISDWISDDETAEGAILQAIQTEAAARTNADNLKLDKPTTTSNTTSYPYVVGENGNGGSARLPAGDLGKNFFNSDLSNTTARNHTMNAGVTVNTLGNPHSLAGLPNKNTDIANFRKVRVQNASGLDAVVDSKSMLLDMSSYLTEQERTNWKTAMNGGWTTNTMSVALISPFIIKNDNNVNWILLKGANLNLPPTSFEVAIMNEAGTSVLAIVPNSQVQLYTNGTDLIFYYNFFTLGLGKYKIRLWNGVAYYITNSKLTITDTITNIPFQQGEIRLVSGSSSINVATAYEVILKPDPNIKELPTNNLSSLTDIVSNWVDGNVLQGNEDWWVQLSVECVVKANWFSRLEIANVGLSSSSSSSLLSPIVGGILIYNQSTNQNVQDPDIGIIGGDTLNDLANGSQINYIKIGSILQILIVASNGNIVSSIITIDTSQNYRLVANCNNQPTNTQLNYHTGIKLTKVRMSNL